MNFQEVYERPHLLRASCDLALLNVAYVLVETKTLQQNAWIGWRAPHWGHHQRGDWLSCRDRNVCSISDWALHCGWRLDMSWCWVRKLSDQKKYFFCVTWWIWYSINNTMYLFISYLQTLIKSGTSRCKNVNYARRTACNLCSKERILDAAARKKLGTEIGKAAADKSRGLFSAEDWQCSKCANVNWARRSTCNMCNAPKFTENEERTGAYATA